jgi:hypothetical protein
MTSAYAGAATLFAVDYTPILAAAVTGLTAAAVGVIGYFSTRMTADVQKTQTAAETERLRNQQEEERRKYRQDLYLQLLSHERSFFNLTGVERGEISLESFDTWWKTLNDLLTGVMLFGTEPTARASAGLFTIVGQVNRKARNLDGRRFDESLSEAFEPHIEEWRQARRSLLDEMRKDVSADRAGVEWPATD